MDEKEDFSKTTLTMGDGILSAITSSGFSYSYPIDPSDLMKMADTVYTEKLDLSSSPLGPSDTMLYTFESAAGNEHAEQLNDERENLIAGIKATEQTVLYYNDKLSELHEQLNIVEEQLDSLKPGSFVPGEFKLSQTDSLLVLKLEREIVNSIKRNPSDPSEKIILVSPHTFMRIFHDMHTGMMSSVVDTTVKKLHYKGIPVYRSLDIEDDEIIVK